MGKDQHALVLPSAGLPADVPILTELPGKGRGASFWDPMTMTTVPTTTVPCEICSRLCNKCANRSNPYLFATIPIASQLFKVFRNQESGTGGSTEYRVQSHRHRNVFNCIPPSLSAAFAF